MNPSPLTAADLAAIRARCEAATPGPWHVLYGRFGDIAVCRPDLRADGSGISMVEFAGDEPTMDESLARFIAHARADVPRLLDENEWLRGTLEEIAEHPIGDQVDALNVRDIARAAIQAWQEVSRG